MLQPSPLIRLSLLPCQPLIYFCPYGFTYCCCCSVAHLCLTLQPHGLQHTRLPLSFTISQSLLRFMSIESVLLSSHLIFCHSLLLLLSVFPSIRVFPSEFSLCIRWPKYWSFSFSISPSNEYSELISFRMDWFVFLAVQGTLKSLLQHHNSKASIHQHSAFFMVQLSHSHMTPGKTISLTIWIFVSKVMSLLFNMLSRFVIAFFQHNLEKHQA